MSDIQSASAPRRRRRRLWLGLAIAFALPLAALVLAPETLLPPVAAFLNVSDPVRPVDAVLVLGGDADVRPFYAAAVYRAGYARKVLVTRPRSFGDATDGYHPPFHVVTVSALLASGVPDEDVFVLPGEVDSTVDELRELKEYLQRNDETVTILSTEFHTRRIRLLARRMLGKETSRVRILGVPAEEFADHNWWRSRAGAIHYLREYVKLVYYNRDTVLIGLAIAAVAAAVWFRRRRRKV